MRQARLMVLWGLLLAGMCVSAQAAGNPIYTYDMSGLLQLDRNDPVQARRAWDTAHLVTSIQGIVNREGPVFFVRFMAEPDDFWFDYLRSEGQWLAGREVIPLGSLEEILDAFATRLRGIVVYDDRVAATSNLASTIAGVEDRACLRYDAAPDSIYERVVGTALPFTANALRLFREDGTPMFTGTGTIPGSDTPSTGSAKCDAYIWAKQRYLDKGLCSGDYMAYYLDAYWLRTPLVSGFENATLTNHDFFIGQRAFFFDLHVWEEETPVDDPGQRAGTDVATLRALLRSMTSQMKDHIYQIGGFTPWAWKYTDHPGAGGRHGGVDTEWKYAQIISAYNGVMDADALGLSGMANASFYQHYPLKERYPQNPKPTEETLKDRGLLTKEGKVAPKTYVCFYMGDYDSAAWFNSNVPKWWKDPAHGETLCNWAFNPNLDRRAPHAMDYVRTHQSANDWFMYGDSGAGYLNPGMLVAPRADSGLPDGLDAWIAHNRPYADRYDLSITGFIIDGHSPGMGDRGMDAYLCFSRDGIVGQKIPPRGLYRDTMPYIRMAMDLYGTPEEAGARIAGLSSINRPRFLFIRTILQSPSWHKGAMEAARAKEPNIEFVDPYSFFLLLAADERAKTKAATDAGTKRKDVSFIPPDQREGLAALTVGDGPFEVTEAEGRPVLHQAKPKDTEFLYFEVEDGFARSITAMAEPAAVVTVSVFDAGPGTLGIHYNAKAGDYAQGPMLDLTGTRSWRDVSFVLDQPVFTHGQNAGADFRIVNPGLDLLVSKVSVIPGNTPPAPPAPPERIKAFCVDFNWGPDGFAPPGMYANANPQEHIAWYKAMGVNTIQSFCVSCPGYAWYESRVAPVQPGMKGEFILQLAAQGHAAGMRVMGYFCIGANTHWSELHPDEVHPLPSQIAIPFTARYLDYLDAVIREAVSETHIDGFMIDWMYNASHHYPGKTYAWLDCEKVMYQELFGEAFPGDAAMTQERIDAFNQRATDRCWERIRKAAKETNPDCIIWLSAYDLEHVTLKGSKMLQEVDWVMNENPDTGKLEAIRKVVGPKTKLIQCICGWGDQHNAEAVLKDPRFSDVGVYGFAKPDAETTLPRDDGSGNARNINAMRAAFTGN